MTLLASSLETSSELGKVRAAQFAGRALGFPLAEVVDSSRLWASRGLLLISLSVLLVLAAHRRRGQHAVGGGSLRTGSRSRAPKDGAVEFEPGDEAG